LLGHTKTFNLLTAVFVCLFPFVLQDMAEEMGEKMKGVEYFETLALSM
jgi:hypothetical protein